MSEAAVAIAIAERQAKPGTLGLPALLEERRRKYLVPNGAFNREATFDRVLLWQIPDWEGDTFGDTKIVMPERSRQSVRDSAPRGIVITAGLQALDVLRSNGIELGHVVNFLRLAPWRLRCDTINGVEQYVLVIRAGDIVSSEDLRQELIKNPKAIEYDADSGQHVYRSWGAPKAASIPDDY